MLPKKITLRRGKILPPIGLLSIGVTLKNWPVRNYAYVTNTEALHFIIVQPRVSTDDTNKANPLRK